MPQVIHIGMVRQGQITVYSDGDYVVVYGTDPADVDAIAEYFRSGSGPEDLELLVQRLVATWNSTQQIAEQRGGGSRRLSRCASPEDRLGVPPHLRSDTSLFRSDLRLQRGGAIAAAERHRRARAALARALAISMAKLHAYLEDLVSQHQQGNLRRFEPVFMGDSTTTPGMPTLRPSELQLAIEAGQLVDLGNDRLALADRSRGIGDSIVSRLGADLPGFAIQYNIAYEQARSRITQGYLETGILAVIDIVAELVTLGVSGAVTSVVRTMRTGLTRLRAARNARAATHATPPGAASLVDEVPSVAANPRGTSLTERGLTPEAPSRPSRAGVDSARGDASPPAAANSEPPRPSGGGFGGARRPRREGSIRGTRRLSDGEARVSDAFAREGRDVFNIPESAGDWQDLVRTRPGHTRGSEGQRGPLPGRQTGRDGASMTRAQREEYQQAIREARIRDRLPPNSKRNPDHLIDGRIWDTKVLERGRFDPTAVESNIFSSVGRGQSRRIAIDVQNVIEEGVLVPARTLIRRYRQWLRRNRSAAELRHGPFGAEVNEVVFVQNGRIFSVYRR